jgi:hypothetical protein
MRLRAREPRTHSTAAAVEGSELGKVKGKEVKQVKQVKHPNAAKYKGEEAGTHVQPSMAAVSVCGRKHLVHEALSY